MDGNEHKSAPLHADGDAGAPADTPRPAEPARPASEAETPATAPPAPTAGSGDGDGATAAPAPPTPATAPTQPTPAVEGEPASASGGDGVQPNIFDLPDEHRNGKGDGTIVLGGAAAAEGRTTGRNPRIAGPASSTSRLTPPGGDEAAPEATDERGRHFSSGEPGGWRSRWPLLLAAVPVVALVLLIGGWAVDTAALSGQVMRNVEVAGRSVGGLGEASLPEVMEEVNAELASRPVTLTSGDREYETTAGEIGLTVDAEATAEAALDAGRGDFLLTRPFNWLGSFFSPREVDLEYTVAQAQVLLKVVELQGGDVTAAKEPTIQLGEQGWTAVPGTPGEGIDPEAVAEDLPAAAEANPTGTIELTADRVPIDPQISDAEAEALAERANTLTANGMTLTAGETSKQVSAEQLRTWIGPTTEGGELDLAILPDVVTHALPELFADVAAEPADASFDLQGGTPVVVPSRQGVECCADDSPELVWKALSSGKTEAALEVVITEPGLTTEAAEGLGITQAVGGNHAWRDGAATTAGPGFTTYHAGGEPRVTNIHRMADIVRGAVILPGETFSINEHVGERTRAKGFVEAGAIRDGEHVPEVGGGVSQFATTMFNAAYYAGLDIPVSQAHSEYFSRYPLGREATMGFPVPDLQVRNNTEHGVLIWTSYTDTSLTVTLYSTPYATAEQTGISESMSGACRVVTTTRTRTYPNGETETDTFRATYRPGEGQPC
ncbi:MAG TPA: VanW family protein [Acidimicrobiales bacterium]|nr:VanW family protein [Acidimicrobiales bacterium]